MTSPQCIQHLESVEHVWLALLWKHSLKFLRWWEQHTCMNWSFGSYWRIELIFKLQGICIQLLPFTRPIFGLRHSCYYQSLPNSQPLLLALQTQEQEWTLQYTDRSNILSGHCTEHSMQLAYSIRRDTAYKQQKSRCCCAKLQLHKRSTDHCRMCAKQSFS